MVGGQSCTCDTSPPRVRMPTHSSQPCSSLIMSPRNHAGPRTYAGPHSLRHYIGAPVIFLLCCLFSLMYWRHIRCMRLPWAGAPDIFLHFDLSSAFIAHLLATDSPYASLGCRGSVGSAYSAAPLQESASRATALPLILVYRA